MVRPGEVKSEMTSDGQKTLQGFRGWSLVQRVGGQGQTDHICLAPFIFTTMLVQCNLQILKIPFPT